MGRFQISNNGIVFEELSSDGANVYKRGLLSQRCHERNRIRAKINLQAAQIEMGMGKQVNSLRLEKRHPSSTVGSLWWSREANSKNVLINSIEKGKCESFC